MSEPRADPVYDYIAQNQDRYTRDAITQLLLEAGHDREAIRAAWLRAAGDSAVGNGADSASGPPSGWMVLALLVAGAVLVAISWAGEPYGAQAIAPIVYGVVASLLVGGSWGISRLARRGSGRASAIWLGLLVMTLAGLLFWATQTAFSVAVLVVGGVMAVSLAVAGPRSERLIAAMGWFPVIVWLILTGTCVAPAVLNGWGR